MREILFRGRRIDNGEWVFGYSIFCASRVFIVDRDDKTSLRGFTTNRCDKYDWRSVEVDPATVGQYTGLTDKNGEKIFEGDIIKDTLGWVYEVRWDNDDGRFLGYHSKPRGNTYICYVNREPKATIIGNIHDNPGLMELSNEDTI